MIILAIACLIVMAGGSVAISAATIATNGQAWPVFIVGVGPLVVFALGPQSP